MGHGWRAWGAAALLGCAREEAAREPAASAVEASGTAAEVSPARAPEAPDVRAAPRSSYEGPAPLWDWMDTRFAGSLRRRDLGSLRRGFGYLATVHPEGDARWVAIARSGEAAAARRDLAGVREACAACHRALRAGWRQRYRGHALPSREEED